MNAMQARLVPVLFAIALALLPMRGDAGPTWTSGVYRYDGAGNIVSIGTTAYGYDAAGRITQAQVGIAPVATHEYQYDPYGNRTAYAVNQQWVSVPIASDTNRLSDATYDASGNQLSRGATSATYDGFGMMTTYRFDAVNAEAFVYNASDERIGVLRDDEWTWSLRDAGGRVLRQYRSSAMSPGAPWVWLEDFVYRGALLLGSDRLPAEGGPRHYHLDHLGSPRLVTSAAGSVVSEHEFLPFGEERTAFGQEAARGFDREFPHRFTGHERDFDVAPPNDSSAYVDSMHARYYAASTGRFLSVDPTWESADLGNPQSWNRYAYVQNNPVNYADPDGRMLDPRAVKPENLARQIAIGAAQGIIGGATKIVVDGVLPDGQSDNGKDAASPPRTAEELEQRVSEGRARPTVQDNKKKGDAFRDQVADALKAEGREVRTEVMKDTGLGARRMDIEVTHEGRVVGGIETKTGKSRYTPSQRAKDAWLRKFKDYIVVVVRKTF